MIDNQPYAKQPFEGELRQSQIDYYTDMLGGLSHLIGLRVLQVGCGGGEETLLIHKILEPKSIVAIDLYDKTIEIAKKRCCCLKNVLFKKKDLFSLDKSFGSFDLIWCNGVLHHTTDPYGGFKILEGLTSKYLLIGLNHKYAQFPFLTTKQWFMGFFAKEKRVGIAKKLFRNPSGLSDNVFFADLFCNIQKKFTISEVMKWVDKDRYVTHMIYPFTNDIWFVLNFEHCFELFIEYGDK